MLSIWPNLWLFFLLVLLLGVFTASRIYGLIPTKFPLTFWTSATTTAIILLGSAVQDTENGKDVYKAFAVRMGLFLAVALYAWVAAILVKRWRSRRRSRRGLRPDLQ